MWSVCSDAFRERSCIPEKIMRSTHEGVPEHQAGRRRDLARVLLLRHLQPMRLFQNDREREPRQYSRVAREERRRRTWMSASTDVNSPVMGSRATFELNRTAACRATGNARRAREVRRDRRAKDMVAGKGWMKTSQWVACSAESNFGRRVASSFPTPSGTPRRVSRRKCGLSDPLYK